MLHTPVNHHLRPVYRVLAAIVGAYILIFGAVGLTVTLGDPWFEQGPSTALGLRTNLAFSVASIVAGATIVLALLVGRNIDYLVNLAAGVGFLVAGLAMMALLRTDLNVLNFSIATCVVSFVVGTVLGSAGLYTKVGTVQSAAAMESLRHGGH